MAVLKKVRNIILIILSVIIGLIVVAYLILLGRGGDYYTDSGEFVRIDSSHSFNYIMKHPALDGLGEEVLPLGNDLLRTLCGPWKLKIMIPFLGKHEETVVNGLNYAIETKENGDLEFLSFYDESAVASDSAKENTGLMYYKTADGAPFVLVAPGGGFTMLGVASSAYPYAQPLQEAGYNVFVLKYRVGVYENEEDKVPATDRASEDVAAAVSYILANADSLGVDSENYIVLGSSAGGQLTARFCAEYDFARNDITLPKACIMLYPANCQRYDYTDCSVPMYITVCQDDPQIDVNGLDTAVEAMKAAGMTVSYNKFPTGGHSFGIGVGTPAEGWMERAIEFAAAYIYG